MIGIVGAGAFGTALALTLAQAGNQVQLWARDGAQVAQMRATGLTAGRLAGFALPPSLALTHDLSRLGAAKAIVIAVPMQQIGAFFRDHVPQFGTVPLIAAAKGIDTQTLRGPASLLALAMPGAPVAVLTGPGFAADIARGLPTALTLACADETVGVALQGWLSSGALRLYRTTDVTGAELGGALKNVIAIAAGIVIGRGLGESARAALITRGLAEMMRFALLRGARTETLMGLSGLGDLVLTCSSAQSRNFSHGFALGAGQDPDSGATIEGIGTARAVTLLSEQQGIDMPLTRMVNAILQKQVSIESAIGALMARPLKQE